MDHSTGVITTVAGVYGTSGYNGDNIQATAASLAGPEAIALDTNGNLFIADTQNQRIREVVLATGIITTVAGSGTVGYNGDNIGATTAKMDYPNGVAVDTNGNLFIADTSNQRIRKVVLSTGIITTVAGNGTAGYNGDNIAATTARISSPGGVTVDTNGDLFIADTQNHRIREVNLSTGTIATVAGNGNPGFSGDGGQAKAALLYQPSACAIDGSGDLLVADYGNGRLRRVTLSTGLITTIAGGGSELGDSGPAASSVLSFLRQLAVDAVGNIYIANPGYHRIRKIATGNTSANITPAILTVTADDKSRFYGAFDLPFTGTISGFQNGETLATSGVSGNPVLTPSDTSTSPVGTYSITASPGTLAAQNYNFTFASGSLNVTPVPLTASVAIGDKIYDGTTAASITGRSLSGVIGSDDVSLTGGTAAFADRNVGTGKAVTVTGLSLSGGAAGNYFVNTAASANASITPAPLTPIILVANKVYDGTGAATITGQALNGVIRLDNVSLTAGTAVFMDPNVGTGQSAVAAGLGLTGIDAGNYLVDSTASATADITRALLTVTADSKSRAYGAVNPPLTYTCSGFANGDSSTVVNGTPGLSTTATSTSVPGIYTINIAANSLTADNYTFSLIAGSLTVTRAASGTVVTSNNGSSAFEQSVTFTAAVTPSSEGVASGTVQFQIDGGNVGDPVTLVGGMATYTVSSLEIGGHSVVAVYGGDGNFTASTSPAFTQYVAPTSLTSNVLTLYGTSGADTMSLNAAGGIVTATVNGSDLTFPAVDVHSIRVLGVAGADTLSLTGGPFTFNTDVQADAPNLAITVGAGATASFEADEHVVALAIGANGAGTLAAGANTVLVTNSLSIDGAGNLDVNDGTVVVKGGSLGAWNSATSTYSGVSGMLASGYASGAWTGPGIRSATASLEAQMNHGLGVLTAQQAQDNGNALTGGFRGQSVSGSDVLVQYGWNGDMNMDGAVDYLDYGAIDNAYLYNQAHPGTPKRGYASGDLNFDGVINYLDYGMMDNAFLAQNAPHATGAMASAASAGDSAVPAAIVPGATLFSTNALAAKPTNDSSNVLTAVDPGVL